jgi:hypothetical protein
MVGGSLLPPLKLVAMISGVNCKMRLFAMKYTIEFEEKIN